MSANTFLATTGEGLSRATRSADGTWSVEFLLTDQDVRCLAADPRNVNVVYAGTQGNLVSRAHPAPQRTSQGNGVWRSTDAGKRWQASGLDGKIVKALAVSALEPNTIYAGTKSPPLIFVSRDGGASWNELLAFRKIRSRIFWLSPAEKPFTPYVSGITLSPTDPNVIVVGIEAGAVVRSADGGQTWTEHRKGALRDCHSITFHVTNGNWVYEGGGTGAGVAFSHDGGETWTQPKAGLERHYGWACAADPADPEIWYASLSTGPFKAHSESDAQAYIFRSQHGGPWQRLGDGLPQPLDHMPYALLTDPAIPGHLYGGLSSGDVWHSTDHGDTWQKLPFNLHHIQRAMIML